MDTTTKVTKKNENSLTLPPAEFGDRPVETPGGGTPSAFTESALGDLNEAGRGLIQRTAVIETKTPPFEITPELREVVGTLKSLSESVNSYFAEGVNKSVILDQREVAILLREQKMDKKEKDELNKGVDDASAKRKLPLYLIVNGIQSRLPGLEEAYKKMLSANTQESKAKFVALYMSEIRSAFNNVVSTAKDFDFANLKTDVTDGVGKLEVFDQAEYKSVLPFIKAALTQIQDPKAPLPLASKLDKLYDLLSCLKPFVAITGIYSLGYAESSIVAMLPEAISNLLLAIQQYAGAPTVPLLCFGIAYILHLMYELGMKIKNSKYPVTPEVQLERQNKVLLDMFAKQSIAV